MNMKESHVSDTLAKVALNDMPLFNGFSDIDYQKLLELMQQPVRAIDTCMGKEQLRTVAKQLLAQNLALQTRVRNAEIKTRDDAQAFEHGFQELDKAVARMTDFEGIEDMMMKLAEEDEMREADAQTQGHLFPEGEV